MAEQSEDDEEASPHRGPQSGDPDDVSSLDEHQCDDKARYRRLEQPGEGPGRKKENDPQNAAQLLSHLKKDVEKAQGVRAMPPYLVFLTAFLAINFLTVIESGSDAAGYYRSQAPLTTLTADDFAGITDRDAFWKWLQGVVPGLVHSSEDDVGWLCEKCHCGHDSGRCFGDLAYPRPECCKKRTDGDIAGPRDTNHPLVFLLMRQFRSRRIQCSPDARPQMFLIPPTARGGFPDRCAPPLAHGEFDIEDFGGEVKASEWRVTLHGRKKRNIQDSVGLNLSTELTLSGTADFIIGTQVREIADASLVKDENGDQVTIDPAKGWLVVSVNGRVTNRDRSWPGSVTHAINFAPPDLEVDVRREISNPPPWHSNIRRPAGGYPDVHSISLPGVLADYRDPSKAYSAYFSFNRPLEQVKLEIEFLQEKHWIDDATRAVLVELLSFNEGEGSFAITSLMLEFTESGIALPSVHSRPFTFHNFWQAKFYVVLALDVIIVLFLAWEVISGAVQLWYNKHKGGLSVLEQTGVNGVVQVIKIVLFGDAYASRFQLWYLGWALYDGETFYDIEIANFLVNDTESVDIPVGSPTAPERALFHTCARYADYHASAVAGFAACNMLLWVRGVGLMAYTDRFGVLSQTLRTARPNLVSWFLIFTMIFIPFVFAGHITFGSSLTELKSVVDTTTYLLFMIARGEVGNYDQMDNLQHIFTPVYVTSFLALSWLLMLNMFIAIVTGTFEVVQTAASMTGGADNSSWRPAAVWHSFRTFMVGTVWRDMLKPIVWEGRRNVEHFQQHLVETAHTAKNQARQAGGRAIRSGSSPRSPRRKGRRGKKGRGKRDKTDPKDEAPAPVRKAELSLHDRYWAIDQLVSLRNVDRDVTRQRDLQDIQLTKGQFDAQTRQALHIATINDIFRRAAFQRQAETRHIKVSNRWAVRTEKQIEDLAKLSDKVEQVCKDGEAFTNDLQDSMGQTLLWALGVAGVEQATAERAQRPEKGGWDLGKLLGMDDDRGGSSTNAARKGQELKKAVLGAHYDGTLEEAHFQHPETLKRCRRNKISADAESACAIYHTAVHGWDGRAAELNKHLGLIEDCKNLLIGKDRPLELQTWMRKAGQDIQGITERTEKLHKTLEGLGGEEKDVTKRLRYTLKRGLLWGWQDDARGKYRKEPLPAQRKYEVMMPSLLGTTAGKGIVERVDKIGHKTGLLPSDLALLPEEAHGAEPEDADRGFFLNWLRYKVGADVMDRQTDAQRTELVRRLRPFEDAAERSRSPGSSRAAETTQGSPVSSPTGPPAAASALAAAMRRRKGAAAPAAPPPAGHTEGPAAVAAGRGHPLRPAGAPGGARPRLSAAPPAAHPGGLGPGRRRASAAGAAAAVSPPQRSDQASP
eukprot:TRINITY_DN25771_c0_g1_i1.p1 TRINITY_DN25771_c0_g1~~TRINITY_DN25771_c0_g1_i1.p1  ORF type:complete len:1403 (+),score=467.33 TRINITY_DN25771_c0_g1_i1:90-4211(+)